MPSIYHDQALQHGLGDSHRLLLARLPQAARVLDVGCASGYLAQAALHAGARWVDGLELAPADAALARAHCRTVHEGSAEDPAAWSHLDGPYDAVVFGDVLEHLVHPERALTHALTVLASDGVVVASIPNVAHYTIRSMLLRGRFDYEDYGILDRTHLRFFTRRDIVALFEDHGLVVQSIDPVLSLPQRSLRPVARVLGYRRTQRWATAVARRVDTLFAVQFVVVARPREARP